MLLILIALPPPPKSEAGQPEILEWFLERLRRTKNGNALQ
jgi:hypothetical protein